jgi:DNA phosphorothioation-dependent restriction protein DptG
MAKFEILYWQDLPSLVEASDDDGTKKIQLSQRFQDLIDYVAMETGLAGTDDYLEKWTRGESQERDGTAEEVVKAVADEFEAQFEDIKAAAVAEAAG